MSDSDREEFNLILNALRNSASEAYEVIQDTHLGWHEENDWETFEDSCAVCRMALAFHLIDLDGNWQAAPDEPTELPPGIVLFSEWKELLKKPFRGKMMVDSNTVDL